MHKYALRHKTSDMLREEVLVCQEGDFTLASGRRIYSSVRRRKTYSIQVVRLERTYDFFISAEGATQMNSADDLSLASGDAKHMAFKSGDLNEQFYKLIN